MNDDSGLLLIGVGMLVLLLVAGIALTSRPRNDGGGAREDQPQKTTLMKRKLDAWKKAK